MKTSLPCMIVLAACSAASNQAEEHHGTSRDGPNMSETRPGSEPARIASQSIRTLPEKYMKAFACVFDENPLAAYERYHGTPAGRAERADDLKALRSLGFSREARDGDLESVGGKIPAPPGLTLFGLPVWSVRINGMIGDANSMYITTFDDRVTVDQVVKAARLDLDRKSYDRYRMRHYSRLIGNNPHTELSLDDVGDGEVALVCQIQSTPD